MSNSGPYPTMAKLCEAIRAAALDPEGMTDGERRECFDRLCKSGYAERPWVEEGHVIEAELEESGVVIETFDGDEREFKKWLDECSRSASSEEWSGSVRAREKESQEPLEGSPIHVPL
jgi:hypothetical protein